MLTDGRSIPVSESPGGFCLGATVFDEVSPDMKMAKDEIFGHVASVMHVENLDEVFDQINGGTSCGNMASIFTTGGSAAREFRRQVNAGNVGINICVAAPSAYFRFRGMKEPFFGVLYPQIDTVDFFTDRKVTITRW